jgi:hypothetical protein
MKSFTIAQATAKEAIRQPAFFVLAPACPVDGQLDGR